MLLAAKQGTGTVTITQLALGDLPLNHQETNFGLCMLDWNREMGHHGKGKLNTLLTSPKKKALGYFRRTQIPDSDHTVNLILNYKFFSKHSHYFFFSR